MFAGPTEEPYHLQPKSFKEVMDSTASTLFLTDLIRGQHRSFAFLRAYLVVEGMGLTLAVYFREPATIYYPFEKGPLSPRFRGLCFSRRLSLGVDSNRRARAPPVPQW